MSIDILNELNALKNINQNLLPKTNIKTKIPPIKIQGIKTKLVPFILKSINWDGKGVYYEPFMGSGVVGFNIAPKNAVFSDTNPHIIQFYNDLKYKKINSEIIREHLEIEAEKLSQTPNDKNSYYYQVRERFNKQPNSLDFLFLQRSNFNGLMRFNSKGEYNVPFGRKPNRFKKALITKIVNQVRWVENLIDENNWEFRCCSFDEIFKLTKKEDFIYLDPPYLGRYDGYFDTWSERLSNKLINLIKSSEAGYAFSMWYENAYRKNDNIDNWGIGKVLKLEHFYHLGANENNRNKIIEALIINPKNIDDLDLHL